MPKYVSVRARYQVDEKTFQPGEVYQPRRWSMVGIGVPCAEMEVSNYVVLLPADAFLPADEADYITYKNKINGTV